MPTYEVYHWNFRSKQLQYPLLCLLFDVNNWTCAVVHNLTYKLLIEWLWTICLICQLGSGSRWRWDMKMISNVVNLMWNQFIEGVQQICLWYCEVWDNTMNLSQLTHILWIKLHRELWLTVFQEISVGYPNGHPSYVNEKLPLGVILLTNLSNYCRNYNDATNAMHRSMHFIGSFVRELPIINRVLWKRGNNMLNMTK